MPNANLLALPFDDNFEVVEALERGIPARALARLAGALKLALPIVAAAVRIPQRTLERRLANNALLREDEAERALRVARLFAKAKEVLASEDEAAGWFVEPLAELRGKRPLDLCATEPGAREVEQVLGRIEHGVFG